MTKKKIDEQFWQEIGNAPSEGLHQYVNRHGIESSVVLASAMLERFSEDSFKDIYIEKSDNSVKPVYQLSLSKIAYYLNVRKLRIVLHVILVGFSVLIFATIVKTAYSNSGQSIVTKKKGIPAYSKISHEDIKVSHPFRGFSEPPKENPFIGRYTLSAIEENALISEEILLNAQLNAEMENRLVILLPVKPENSGGLKNANSKIGLIFSPTKESSAKAITLSEVILLGLEKKDAPTTLVVGITRDQLSSIQDIMAISSVFVIVN
jgi:hypothetical protein